jgi:hypothetical protein
MPGLVGATTNMVRVRMRQDYPVDRIGTFTGGQQIAIQFSGFMAIASTSGIYQYLVITRIYQQTVESADPEIPLFKLEDAFLESRLDFFSGCVGI